MPSPSENPIHRRRAVFTALQKILSEDEATLALCIWSRGFADRPGFALQELCRTLDAEISLGDRRKSLYRELVSCMFLPEAELGPDPAPLIRTRCNGASPAPAREQRSLTPDRPAPDPGAQVFAILYGAFLLRLRLAEAPGLEDRLQRLRLRLREIGLGGAAADAFRGWLTNPGPQCPHPLPQDLQHRLVHELYVGACESLGPVDADRLLAEAIREAEEVPAARAFSPRELL